MSALTAPEERVRTARWIGATPLLSNAFGIRALVNEIGDHLALCVRVPVLWAGTSVGGVVERFGSPSVHPRTPAPRATSSSDTSR